ncbi:DNA polymerase III subunit delta [Neokomagataea thailandica NBRC 106555]|uniref:DNA-directed DNA polymerase n=2 Tax=Neokomagataea TaxID=1223423 RepID=A0A4Y6V9Q8_9PROT|nr:MULTISPECIES: DNA polymerase III subunit delta [Neokomagataea]QDH25410.1 DNA polymerase III subunit delta [Neokomagataea tanensis]GBR53561.1 DNA polymerase III subunit delta [Neokomagataea thailandica NBRC 106555]
MKIDARQVGRALKDAGHWRAILLYGEDSGLIRERAAQAVRCVAETLDDPFRVAQLDRETHDRLEEEATALSLIGGRRVVWVREGGDALLNAVTRLLNAASDTLVVLEAPGLTSRSKLRAFAEKHKDVASIACYPEEGRALAQTVTDALSRENITIDRDAMAWLHTRLSADRAGVRGEIEKLALLAGSGGRLDIETVQDCVGDAGGTSLDDAAHAAMAGDVAGVDQALERAFADGAAPVAVARVVLALINKVLRVALAEEEGQTRSEAIKGLRPPIFFKRMPAFTRAVERWPIDALALAAERTQALELACKQSGMPDVVLCKRHLASLCRGGQAWLRGISR